MVADTVAKCRKGHPSVDLQPISRHA
jgi:hypothetical protein